MRAVQSLASLLIFLFISGTTVAQRSRYWEDKPGTWLLNAGLGVTRYTGDLNEPGDLAHLQAGVAANLAVSYRLSYQVSLRAEGQVYLIRGDQSYTRNFYNNLSFISLNPDMWAGVQVDLWRVDDAHRAGIPYALAGVGLTYMTPRAFYAGGLYSLAPMRTEGVDYNRLPLIVRYGFGIPLALGERFRLHLEGTYTHVSSDYLDDVSTVYADQSGKDPFEALLADRRAEIGLPLNRPGEQRGNSTKNDGYFIVAARLIYVVSTPQLRRYKRAFGR